MKNRRILGHFAFWVAYALYDGYLSAPLAGKSYEHLSFAQRLMLGYTAETLSLCFKIPAVYFVLYRVLPQYFKKQNLLLLLVSLASVTVVLAIVNQTLWYKVIYPYIYQVSAPEPAATFARKLLRWSWAALDIFLLLSVTSALRFFRLRLAAAQREKQLMEEKLKSELNFLRTQTNPHFLFNTLNNLYHLARKQNPETPEAILKISSLLRFMLYECATPVIPVAKEIAVIRDYLELERLRYGPRLKVDFQLEIDDESQPIAPLLLLPFVENAFKHGASESRGDTWIDIRLKIQNGALQFRVENAKDAGDREMTEGIGLKNVKRQLALLYPDHRLLIENQADTFLVDLKFQLKDIA